MGTAQECNKLNKSWNQHLTKQQLYGHLPPICKTIQIRQTRHAGHCWISKDKLISHIILWTLSHGSASVGQPMRTYLRQICTDTGCNLEDCWKQWMSSKRIKEIHASSVTWWWRINEKDYLLKMVMFYCIQVSLTSKQIQI